MATYCNVKHCRYPATHVTASHQCGTCSNYGHGQIECGHPEMIDSLPLSPPAIPQPVQCTSLACLYPYSHTTEGHRCGMCLAYGHGETECPISDKVVSSLKCPLCSTECMKSDTVVIHEIMPVCHICASENQFKKVCFTKCGHIPMCTDCLETLSDPSGEVNKLEIMPDSHQMTNIKSALDAVGPNHYTRVYGGLGSSIYAVKGADSVIKSYLLSGNHYGQYGVDDQPIIALVIKGKRYVKPTSYA